MNVLRASDLSHDGKPKLENEEKLEQFRHVELHFGDESASKGVGELHVTTRRVFWVDSSASFGYAWTFQSILLHAISTDTDSFVKPCLYCQLQSSEPSEIRLSPENEKDLSLLFDAFSHGALLNPDTDDDETSEHAGEWIYNQDEIVSGNEQVGQWKANLLERFDAMLQIADRSVVDGQFDDAEEEEEEEEPQCEDCI